MATSMIADGGAGCRAQKTLPDCKAYAMLTRNRGSGMFWKRKKAKLSEQEAPVAVEVTPKTKQEELEDAAKKLAASLRSYADASYAAHQPPPDEELKAAHRKVEIARKVVRDGRIAYALGRCLPEHMAHWHAWSQRDDFMKLVGFHASNITSSRAQEEIGVRRIEVTTNDFSFRGGLIVLSSEMPDRQASGIRTTQARSISSRANCVSRSSMSARIS